MASNIENFEISKTFANVVLSNLDSQPDEDGFPFDLNSSANREKARLQDGKGNTSPLYLSVSAVECSAAPQSSLSLARKQEILEGITYLQTASLILG
jgi:hypothetical protein